MRADFLLEIVRGKVSGATSFKEYMGGKPTKTKKQTIYLESYTRENVRNKDYFRHTKIERNHPQPDLHYKKRERKYFRQKENDSRRQYGSTLKNGYKGNTNYIGK